MNDIESSGSTLIANMLNGISSLEVLCTDVLQEISLNDNSTNHLDLLVLKLIENWTVRVNNSKSARCMFSFGGEGVTTIKVIKVVELLKCQKVFCQILLLLPEKKKRNLILELCNVFKLACVDDYCELREILLHQSLTNYSRNIMCKFSQLNKSVIHCFFENIIEIILCNSNITSRHATSILIFLDNVLGNFELFGNYDFDTFALLNKNGKQRIEALLQLCQSCSDGKIKSDIQRDVENKFEELLPMETYSSFLIRLFPMLHEYLKYIELNEESGNIEVFFRVLLKVKHLCYLLSCKEITCSDKQTLLLVAKSFLDKTCEKFIADDVEDIYHVGSHDTLQEQNNGKTDSRMLISRWRVEKEKNNKFLLAVCSLDNLYYGYEECLAWLLSYEELSEKEVNIFINYLTGYTINYGSTSLMQRFMEILHARKKVDGSNWLNYSIQQVVIRCLPYLNVKSCNSLISSCKEYFKRGSSLLWSSAYTKEQFLSSLNEIFNKLTSDNTDHKTFSCLSQLSIISPLVVLQEMIDRIFSGTLNHSVLKGVFLSVPAFFELDSCSKVEECRSPIITYVKNSYVKNKNKPTSRNIITIISYLIEVVPDSLKIEIYHTICDVFLLPNLTHNKSNVFLELEVTLEILDKYLHHPCLNMTALNFNISLCKLLFDVIDHNSNNQRIESVDTIDYMSKLVNLLISNLTNKFTDLLYKEREPILSSITEMLGNYTWSLSFYFYSFFVSNGYQYQYIVPESLMSFCESLDDNMFISSENMALLEDDGGDEKEKWISLFQISYISHEVALLFLEHMPVIVADDEMGNIVEAVATVLSDCASISKAKAVMECLKYIVREQKIEGIISYFRDDLCNEFDHHGACFSMLILIQSFIMHHNDLEEPITCQKHNDVQNYMKIFHLFLLHAKDVEHIQVRSSILLYLLEQLIFITTLFDDFITSILSLLLMDVLMAILDCTKSVSNTVANQVMEQCSDILNIAEGDHSIPLWEKFNMTLSNM